MEINIWQILFQAINFGVILFVLNKFMYKPILDVLEKRERKINEGLAAADKNLKASDEIEKDKKAEIAKARKEALLIIKDAELAAKSKGDEIIADAKVKAKAEAARILESAQAEKSAALKDVEKEAKNLALAMAKKSLSEALSAKEVETITAKLVSKLG